LVGTLSGGFSALASAFSSPTATPSPKTTLVPSLLNLTCDQATQAAHAKGFSVNCVPTTNATVTKGLVFQQEPGANTPAQAGSVITLSVSSGPGTVKVPDVSKMTVADACTALNAVQLQCTQQSTVPSNLPAGQVVSTDPAANSEVAPQTTVNLIVSAGMPTPTTPPVTPTPTIMPTPSPTP
ncbi:MAG: PASTA domain-containing protein, partial [Ktedonobacterales bacterium]